MKDILISVISLVFFSVVVDVVLPTKTRNIRYIKSIFGIAMILIFVTPVIDMVSSCVEQDNGIIYSINKLKLDSTISNIDSILNSSGYGGVRVEIEANLYNYDYSIDKVYVYLYDLVLNNDVSNINISDEILKLIQSMIDIESDKVVFYGN